VQTKLHSLFEQFTNIGSGLLLSTFVVQPIVFPLFNVHTTTLENFAMASVFTVVSIARGYVFRRLFNMLTIRKLNASKCGCTN